jgi:cardiolipin synthase
LRLLVQPGDGIAPTVQAINSAENRIEIAIFRFDRSEIERALANAVGRGVFVHALIAYTNRGGERNLRKLEMRLLGAGVTVARTADDLARYHGKYMIVDRQELHLLAFNFTYLDIEHSRSFGLITQNPTLVQEAVKLFEADTKRQSYVPGLPAFVVSPVNARKQLSAFIQGAKKQLLVYDPEISDPSMIRLLEERLQAGVDIRIIGRLNRKTAGLAVRKMPGMRLHTRTMIRDGHQVFIGSQSLREVELGSRREVGLVFRDPKIVAQLTKIFGEDWERMDKSQPAAEATEPASKVAKKVAKVVAKELPPVTPVLEVIVKEIVGKNGDVDLDPLTVEATVKDAVKEAVQEVVEDVVENVVEQIGLVQPK